MSEVSVAFSELVRRAAAGLPQLAYLFCARCRRVTGHRLAAQTSLGEDIFACERCAMKRGGEGDEP